MNNVVKAIAIALVAFSAQAETVKEYCADDHSVEAEVFAQAVRECDIEIDVYKVLAVKKEGCLLVRQMLNSGVFSEMSDVLNGKYTTDAIESEPACEDEIILASLLMVDVQKVLKKLKIYAGVK